MAKPTTITTANNNPPHKNDRATTRETERQRDRETERQRERQTETERGERDLIKGGEDVVSELDLCNGRRAVGRKADGKACNALLGEGCVEDAAGPCCVGE
jgi:hypothetical protein